MSKTILIVDDEQDIVDMLKYSLQKEGYAVLTGSNGKQALERAKINPDCIILDAMMPEMDGYEVIKKLKRDPATAAIPVIFLTAKTSEVDEVVGLELGADDYIKKPVSIPALLARIKKIVKRNDFAEPAVTLMSFGPLVISHVHHTVSIDGKEIFFPRKEYDLLLYLAKNMEKVVYRESILNTIWGTDVSVIDRTIDVHIRKIREKLGKYSDMIETVKGVGYRMREIE